MDKYEKLEKIGEGAYSKVYKARDKTSNEIVALKKCSIKEEDGVDSVFTSLSREISFLKSLQNENIVRLHDVMMTDKHVYMVLEYLDMDLHQYIETYPEFSEDPHRVKIFLHQILRGTAHCHSLRVLHRDLKPHNVLIDINNNVVKLADFGFARRVKIPFKTLTAEVGTRKYKAPEILLGIKNYYAPVDMWSIGCIFAKMVNRSSLFDGGSEIEQLFSIFSIMGTPSRYTRHQVHSLRPCQPVFPDWPAKDLATVVPNLDEPGLDLLKKLLHMDPHSRITAKAALQHEYFNDMRPES